MLFLTGVLYLLEHISTVEIVDGLVLQLLLHDVLLDGLHELLVLRNQLQCLFDVLEQEQGRVLLIKLQELSQVRVLCALRANTFLFEYAEEVVALQEDHCALLNLRLNLLLKDYVSKEVLCYDVLIEQVQHQHQHYLDGLLV